MSKVLEQLKDRRKALGLRQEDMANRTGMSRQQYQRLERQGNPRLDTLELLAKGVKGELLLVPHDKLALVNALLSSESESVLRGVLSIINERNVGVREAPLSDNPWGDDLGDVE